MSLVCVAVIAVSCAKTPDPEGTFAPRGTLQGTVVDSYDQLPVEGAKITINFDGNSKTLTTDSSGTFSFVDIPASGNINSVGGATGSYSVNLDLKDAKGERTYKQFRTQQVVVQFTELRRADTTTAQTSNAVQDSTPVSYLVSNVTFVVRQARAVINGTVYDEQLKLKGGTTLALISRSSSTSVPNGATVATATTAADGKFSFTGIEEGAQYQLLLPDQNLIFAGGTNNYQGGTFTALELAVVTTLPPVVLGPRPVSDPTLPYVSTTSPAEDAVLAPADITKPIVLKFSEPMNTQRGLNMVTGFRRVGPRNRPDDNTQQQLTILFDKKWDVTGTELTITPTTPLEAGFRYTIDINNALITDIAGNQRNRFIPYTQPQAPDALSISNGQDDLVFAIGSDATALSVAAVTQEPDTADNALSVVATRASVVESDPASTESSFLGAQNAGFYTVNRSDNAYITWAAPSQPVRRYRMWTRVGTNNPILISRSNNPWGVSGSTRLDPIAPSQTAFNIPLSDLSQILANEPGGFPQVGLPNTVWNNGLTVQLGVSVVNADGQEGDVVYTTLKDNTGPGFSRTAALGLAFTYLNPNDSVSVGYTSSCFSNLNARVVCPKIANNTSGMPAVTTFGQRMVQFDLSEPVDAASVILANVDVVDDVLANNLGVTNPNVSGGSTEADATIASVVPLNVVNGRATRIGVVFNNFFGIDTGDKFVLRKTATAAIKDISGNNAKDAILINASLVDDYPPMLKAVSADPTADTVTLVYTKWFSANQTPVPSQGNVSFNEINATNFSYAFSSFSAGSATLTQATKSISSSNEAQVVLQFSDVGYLRGYNSSDPSCSRGTRFSTPGFTSVDFSSPNARSSSTVNDEGTLAYENVLADPTEPNFSPGAYLPVSGVGTRSSFRDTIAPRLSNNHVDRTLSPFTNTATVAGNGTTTTFVDVSLTEFSANENAPTAANSAVNPANWQATAIDLGADNWVGNTASDPSASGIAITVNSVQLIQTNGSGCARNPRYRLSLTLTNSDGAAKTVGFNRITIGAAVADMAGNVIGATGRHTKWAYNPARTDVNGATDPGWVTE